MSVSPTNLPHNEHIWVIPVTRTGELLMPVLAEADAAHTLPGVGDVTCGAPGVTSELFSPFPDLAHPVLAIAEEDVALHFIEGLPEDCIWLLNHLQLDTLAVFRLQLANDPLKLTVDGFQAALLLLRTLIPRRHLNGSTFFGK